MASSSALRADPWITTSTAAYRRQTTRLLSTYRAAFRVPGSTAFCAAAFIMRFSIAVYPIGLVLLISLRTGHYTFAGVLSGIYVFANGAGNPVLARLVDRYGQSRVLLPASAVHVAAVVAQPGQRRGTRRRRRAEGGRQPARRPGLRGRALEAMA